MKKIRNDFNIVTVVLKYEEIKKYAERITKTKPFKWEGINFPSKKDDWKKFEKNNVTVAFNVLYAKERKKISCLCFKK